MRTALMVVGSLSALGLAQGAVAYTPSIHAYGEYTDQDFDLDIAVEFFEDRSPPDPSDFAER